MVLPLVLVTSIVLFAIQLLLCFRCRRKWLRLAPVVTACAVKGICLPVFFLTRDSMLNQLFGAYILAMIVLHWLAAMALAWAVYGIVKTVQKRGK